MFESLLVTKNGDACVDDVRNKPTEICEIGFGSVSSAKNGNAHFDDVRIESTELSFEPQNFDKRNVKSSYESPKLQEHMKIDEKNVGDCLKKIDDLCEEPVQTTPPSVVICDKVEVNADARKTQEVLLVGNASEN